jgi:hypothetical protein
LVSSFGRGKYELDCTQENFDIAREILPEVSKHEKRRREEI